MRSKSPWLGHSGAPPVRASRTLYIGRFEARKIQALMPYMPANGGGRFEVSIAVTHYMKWRR
jgi:hypothetical protein